MYTAAFSRRATREITSLVASSLFFTNSLNPTYHRMEYESKVRLISVLMVITTEFNSTGCHIEKSVLA